MKDSGTGPSFASPARVLVSEDEAEMRTLLMIALRREGYDVTACPDGDTLLDELAAAACQGEHYDLVISDIRMPGLTGMQVLWGLHGWPGLPDVILITAFGDAETHATAHRLGAAAVLDKPFEPETLLAKVREVLARRGDAGP